MGTSSIAAEHSSAEVFSWLKTLPVAPEYHPTIQEFQDPISYIFKIEKEASQYGICKIVPPLPPQSKKSVISNFNKSISLLNNSEKNPRNNASGSPTFTTRQQQIGFCPRKQRPIHKSVWQSGENYTLQQFEVKAKNFERSYLKNIINKGGKKTVSPLEVETLYWKANGDRPFSVEYANDMPGSAFVPMKERKGGEVATSVGESAWNMRGVARANGSLLRFMKEEIPGVTSPMVYIAMMFSWFAWHVEDHDLHSLNYLHMGASKTWYGVPRDAALAFEEVVRVHGFGEEINPLVTFATLGEKTTVMSPEVLMNAGVPCCRLVQNAGDFVITFPRAYHSGFSHGFNCGEASNIATPEWLRFAEDAAIRRASINYPPMVSHFQLLYDLALSVCSRVPMDSKAEPRSSRLKVKKKGEGEMLIKQMFVEDVIHNNELLYTLAQGSEIVLLPRNSSEKFVWSNLRVGSKYMVKPGLPFSLYGSGEADKASDDIVLARDIKQHKAFYSVKAKLNSVRQAAEHSETETRGTAAGDGLSDRGLFSCVKCGLWTFACVAIVQPTESAAKYLMSADTGFFNDWNGGSGVSGHGQAVLGDNADTNHSDPDSCSGSMQKNFHDGLYDDHYQSTDYEIQNREGSPAMKLSTAKPVEVGSHLDSNMESSALGLLAMTYGNSSDSDEDDSLPNRPTISEDIASGDGSWDARSHQDRVFSPNSGQGYNSGMEKRPNLVSPRSELEDEVIPHRSDLYSDSENPRASGGDSEFEDHNCSAKITEEDTLTSKQNYFPIAEEIDNPKFKTALDLVGEAAPFGRRCDEDSSRMHVFCLEHALEVEKQLQPIGGVNILLLCHPDYPNVQFEAMKVAEELEKDYVWKDIAFSEATKEDEDQIQLALQSEDATPKNGDWAVKLGINLFYSAILSRSPLYSKQLPFNSVIYNAFGCCSPSKSSLGAKFHGKKYGRQRKVTVAGKWCGRVWMSNQVHPSLLQSDLYDEDRALSFVLTSDKKTGRKLDTSSKAPATSANSKIGRKRKRNAKSRVAKKMKFEASELVNSDNEDSPPESVSRRSIRKSKAQLRPAKRPKRHEEDVPDSVYEDSPDDEPRQGPWTSARGLKARGNIASKLKGQQMEALDGSDDNLDDGSLHQGLRSCNRNIFAVGKPTRQLKGRAKELTDSESEDLLSDDTLQERETIGSPELESGSQRLVPKQFEAGSEDEMDGGPSTRLRKRISKPTTRALENKAAVKRQVSREKKVPATKNAPARKGPKMRLPAPKATSMTGPKMRLPASRAPAMKGPSKKAPAVSSDSDEADGDEFCCDIEGCTMTFDSKQELGLHKRNVCPVKGCGKKFFSHKYLVQHRRVHVDDRPLKCPWKGCKMTFKWAWARTEHIRVHTGARPYVCSEPGCGQTFRFVSDFSRHKRKTGHSVKKAKK